MSQQGPHFSPHSKAKANDKSTNKNRYLMVLVTLRPLQYIQETRLKKMIMIIIIIMNLSQEMTVFGGRQKLTSAMK